jgi:ribosome modulation factor
MSDDPKIVDAYQQGYDAYDEGLDEEDNPYQDDIPNAQQWAMGWQDAENEEIEADETEE